MKTRKNRSKKNRTRRQRGGHLNSCIVRKNSPMNPLWKFGNFVTVTEDQFKIANPTQKFCFGDAFTTCMVIVIGMQNNYKVAAHINHVNHIVSNFNEATPKQKYNAETILPFFQRELQTNPNFRSSTIKYIYVITAMDDIKIGVQNGRFQTNIYNEQYAAIRRNESQYRSLTNTNKLPFFESIFPGKITPSTVIDIQKAKIVEHASNSTLHFYIEENGVLNLVT